MALSKIYGRREKRRHKRNYSELSLVLSIALYAELSPFYFSFLIPVLYLLFWYFFRLPVFHPPPPPSAVKLWSKCASSETVSQLGCSRPGLTSTTHPVQLQLGLNQSGRWSMRASLEVRVGWIPWKTRSGRERCYPIWSDANLYISSTMRGLNES